MSTKATRDEPVSAPGIFVPGAFLLDKLPLEAFSRAGEAFKDAYAGYQRELTEFALARLKANVELQEAVVASRDVANLVQAQQRWALAAVQDYLQEGEKLAKLGASTFRHGIDSWLQVASEAKTAASSAPQQPVAVPPQPAQAAA